MRSAGEGDGRRGLALRIENESRERLTAINDRDGSGSAEAINATYRDEEVRLGVSVDIAGVDEERSLRGLLLDCGRGCERG